MSGVGTTIRAVSGDTGAAYILQIVDEDDGTPYDLSPATTRVELAVELAYATGRRLRQIDMPKVTTGTDGQVRLAWSGGEMTGALPGTYEGDVRVYSGTGGRARLTMWDTIRIEVREEGAGYWRGT